MSEHAPMQGDHDPIAMYAHNKAVREAEDKQMRLNKYAPEMLALIKRVDHEGCDCAESWATAEPDCVYCAAKSLLARIEGNGK